MVCFKRKLCLVLKQHPKPPPPTLFQCWDLWSCLQQVLQTLRNGQSDFRLPASWPGVWRCESIVCATECNTMNAFKERQSASVHYLCNSRPQGHQQCGKRKMWEKMSCRPRLMLEQQPICLPGAFPMWRCTMAGSRLAWKGLGSDCLWLYSTFCPDPATLVLTVSSPPVPGATVNRIALPGQGPAHIA